MLGRPVIRCDNETGMQGLFIQWRVSQSRMQARTHIHTDGRGRTMVLEVGLCPGSIYLGASHSEFTGKRPVRPAQTQPPGPV